MALSILNNIPSLEAQNQLSLTNAALQTTLFRLSSGSRINSGADDAAGLAIADGLEANVTALTQSSRNATDGIGKLQVADGALSQTTTLLNRAVTLATEAATGTVSDSQRVALNTEFASIKAEISRIGSQTTYNGQTIFNSAGAQVDKNTLVGSAVIASPTTALVTGKSLVLTDSDTGQSFTFTTNGTLTTNSLIAAINSSTAINATASLNSAGDLQIVDKNGNGSLLVASNNIGELGTLAPQVLTNPNQFVSSAAPGAGALVTGHSFTITDSDSGNSLVFATDGTKTVSDLINAINTSTTINATASLNSNGDLVITDNNGNGSLAVVNSGVTELGTVARSNQTGSSSTDVFLSDGTSVGGGSISVSIGQLSSSNIGFGSNTVDVSTNDLLSQSDATAALTKISGAIANVAADRGSIGAAINRLTAAGNVINSQVQNLTSAEDSIRSADIPSEVANLTKYQILEQTGISALAQANQVQQGVLKLLQ
jgi:flagellin